MNEDKQKDGLVKMVNKGAAIRAMCQTPGFQILQEAFQKKVEKATKKLLDPGMEYREFKVLKQQAQVWLEIEKVLKTFMLTGEGARRALEQLEDLEVDKTSPEVITDKEK